jgi:hypothetical protein
MLTWIVNINFDIHEIAFWIYHVDWYCNDEQQWHLSFAPFQIPFSDTI